MRQVSEVVQVKVQSVHHVKGSLQAFEEGSHLAGIGRGSLRDFSKELCNFKLWQNKQRIHIPRVKGECLPMVTQHALDPRSPQRLQPA